MKKKKYKLGDKIVELGEVFRIIKIKKVRSEDGEQERVVFFKPYYKTKEAAGLICSIPLKNIKKTKMRKPISKKEFQALVKRLKKKGRLREFLAVNKAKDLLKSNDPADAVTVLRMLWKEKKKEKENFSKSKKDILLLAKDTLVQEFALVSGASLEKAGEKIDLALQS